MKSFVPIIKSSPIQMIGSRFRIKLSIMDNDVHKKSIMILVQDLVQEGFTIKFFDNEEDVAAILQKLHTAAIN